MHAQSFLLAAQEALMAVPLKDLPAKLVPGEQGVHFILISSLPLVTALIREGKMPVRGAERLAGSNVSFHQTPGEGVVCSARQTSAASSTKDGLMCFWVPCQ